MNTLSRCCDKEPTLAVSVYGSTIIYRKANTLKNSVFGPGPDKDGLQLQVFDYFTFQNMPKVKCWACSLFRLLTKFILAPGSTRICAPHLLGLITASWLTALLLLNAFFLCTQHSKTLLAPNSKKITLENSKKTSLETRKSLEVSWYVWPLVYRNRLLWVAKDRGGDKLSDYHHYDLVILGVCVCVYVCLCHLCTRVFRGCMFVSKRTVK